MSASIASWSKIIMTILIQVFLVPLYLNNWDSKTYGAWLFLQAIWSLTIIIDAAHHDYIGYECLKVNISNKVYIKKIIISAVPITLFIAIFDSVILIIFCNTTILINWIDGGLDLFNQWKYALILQSITWIFTGSQAGLMVRWFIPFGYNSKFAWWGTANIFIISIFPAIAVFYGANLFEAAILMNIGNILYHVVLFAYMRKIISIESPKWEDINLLLGIKRGLLSLWLVTKGIADIGRQQGVRILLVPFVGTGEMAAFSTMRTGSNLALQGLSTITNPLMPELMRFLVMRDQKRMEGAFAIVWIALCAGLAPCILVVQFIAPVIFPIWTNNKIIYDPWIFSLLSMSILVFALAQPATAIIQGKNHLHSQVILSLLLSIIVVGGIFIFIPVFGITGAAVTLLIAEIISLFGSVLCASWSLKENGLIWPWKPFLINLLSVLITGIILVIMINSNKSTLLLILIIGILAQLFLSFMYIKNLPIIAKDKIHNLFDKIKENLTWYRKRDY